MANNKRQMSLREILVWFVLLSAYFSILAGYPLIQQGFQQTTLAPKSEINLVPASVVLAMCWSILLVRYICVRHFAATAIHTGPLVLTLIGLGVLVGLTSWGELVARCTGAIWLGAVASLPVSIVKSIDARFDKESDVGGYLCFNVLGSVMVIVPICVLVRWPVTRQISWSAIVFGVLLGFWIGLYKAVSTSHTIRQSRFLRMPTRAMITMGFLAAIIGPIVYWYVSTSYGVYLMKPRYSPALGFPAAFLGGAVAWWFARQRETANSNAH